LEWLELATRESDIALLKTLEVELVQLACARKHYMYDDEALAFHDEIIRKVEGLVRDLKKSLE